MAEVNTLKGVKSEDDMIGGGADIDVMPIRADDGVCNTSQIGYPTLDI